MEADNRAGSKYNRQHKRRKVRANCFKKYSALGRCRRRPLDSTNACNFSCRSDNLLNLQAFDVCPVHRTSAQMGSRFCVSNLRRVASWAFKACKRIPVDVRAKYQALYGPATSPHRTSKGGPKGRRDPRHTQGRPRATECCCERSHIRTVRLTGEGRFRGLGVSMSPGLGSRLNRPQGLDGAALIASPRTQTRRADPPSMRHTGSVISHTRPSARQSSCASPPSWRRIMVSVTWVPKPLRVGGRRTSCLGPAEHKPTVSSCRARPLYTNPTGGHG
jgi:hypothetical protein